MPRVVWLAVGQLKFLTQRFLVSDTMTTASLLAQLVYPGINMCVCVVRKCA